MDNIYIQLVNSTDIEYILDNINSIYISSWNKENFLSCLNIQNTSVYVAKNQNIVLGYICIQKVLDQIEILNICVDINHRQKGVGQQLMEYIIELLKQNIFTTIFLEVNVNNIQAINLYKKVGFRIISTRKGYYFNKLTNNKEDAYIMNFKEEYIC